jgi:hypothetical protein
MGAVVTQIRQSCGCEQPRQQSNQPPAEDGLVENLAKSAIGRLGGKFLHCRVQRRFDHRRPAE